MKVKIIQDLEDLGRKRILEEYELKQHIPVPEGKDVYIEVPEGVYRCNVNEGVFPEDRWFFQHSGSGACQYVIPYTELEHLKNPVLSFKVHYSANNDDDNLFIEFR